MASFAVTVIVEVPLPAAIGDVAVTVDRLAETVPAFTTMVAVCVIATASIVAETVFEPAAVELRVPVATPLAFVVALGCVRVFPSVGVAARTTVAPSTGLPFASFAVTVIVDVPLPAAIGDVAVTVDRLAETVPAFTTTVAVWVMAIALIVAETDFDPAAVELRVPVATPLASVVPTGWVKVFPAVGVAARETVAPGIGLPLASFAVTVIVEVPLPAAIGDVAVTVDRLAETVPGFTTTVAVWVIATVLIVADTVFEPATVDDSVPVATPLAFVVPTGSVNVLPPVGVTARVTVAPLIGFPLPSRAVTVIVEVPLPAVIGDVAVTVDCAAETDPAFTTTVAVCVIATASIVVDTVFEPAAVDESVPVATPLASVVPTGCVSVFPALGVAASVTVAPGIGLPFASFAVTVMVEVSPPAAIGDVAATLDCAAETGPGFTATVAVWVMASELIVADTVFVPAAVDESVPVATPLASVVPTGCVSVFPAVGVAASATVAPSIGLPFASRAVTVMVELPLPAVMGEVAVTVDRLAETVAAFTTRVAVWVIATELIVADTVFEPAAVDDSVPVTTPLASVVPTGCVRVFPAVGLAARMTVAPSIGLPLASRAVTVMVEVPLPAAIGDVAVTVDWAADTAPTFTTTVGVCVMATALIVAETVFVPAAVELSVPVATPLAFVAVLGCVSVLPAVGVAARTTVAPSIGLPLASRAVTVMVEVPLPAVIGDVAVTVDRLAETVPASTTTVAVWVIATELIVADTVFEPAALELRVPVATPLAFVVAVGCVSVFPAVGVAASVTVTPSIGLPLASRAVTVMVELPLPAVIGDVADTVDWAADTAPALSAIAPDVAGVSTSALKLNVRSPAVPLIDRLVKVATPPVFVIAVGVPPSVPPPVAIAALTVTPS